MSEINGQMSAKEIALATGFAEPVAKGVIDRPIGAYDAADKKYPGSIDAKLTEAVIGARFVGRHEGGDPMSNAKLEAAREALGKPVVKESSFIVNLKKEEERIIAGADSWTDNVRAFLGNQRIEVGTDALEGDSAKEATGSFLKLEKLKERAGKSFAKMEELAKKLGAKNPIDAKVKLDSFLAKDIDVNGVSVELNKKSHQLNINILNELVGNNKVKSREKLLKKLNIDPDAFIVKTVSDTDYHVANVEELLDIINDGLKATAGRNKDDSDAGRGTKIAQSLRKAAAWAKSGADGKVAGWVDQRVAIDNAIDADYQEGKKYGGDYGEFKKNYDSFNRILTTIANREKVNEEIAMEVMNKVGESQELFNSAQIRKEQDDLMQLQVEHAKKVEASHELVSTELQLKQLREFATAKARMAEASVVALGTASELDGEKAAMLKQIAEGKLPEKMATVFGGDAYKAVEAFIESNGQEGDPKLVINFLDEVKGLMGDKGKTVNGAEVTERAEFLKQSTVTIDGKSVDVGFVIGVATDREGTWTITAAKRSEGGEPIPDSSSMLYLNHGEIRNYAKAIERTQEAVKFFEEKATVKLNGSKIAESTGTVNQLEAQSMDSMSVVEKLNETLVMQRGMLASALKPVGGEEENFAEALKTMSESQQTVVEELYNEAYAGAVAEVAKELGKTPAEVTPAMLAITYAEAMQTAQKAESIVNFLANHDAIMNESLEQAKPELQKLAKQISSLQADRKTALRMENKVVRETAMLEADKQEIAVNELANAIAEGIDASFIASTPESLKTKGSAATIASLTSKDIYNQAEEMLLSNGLDTSELNSVLENMMFDAGMTEQLYDLVKPTRDALAILASDDRSKVLQAALTSGKTEYMAPRIQEVLKSQVDVENNLRTEATKSAEGGKEFAEMSPAERAEAIVKDDEGLDTKIADLSKLTPEDVSDTIDALDSLRGRVAKDAQEEFRTRIVTEVEKALGAADGQERLKALIGSNPESWIEMIKYALEYSDFTTDDLQYAIEVAEGIIDEKKN